MKNGTNLPRPSAKGVSTIKIDFKRMSQEEFARYEDMAIDGRLIYDEYSHSYQDLAIRTGTRGGRKRYARTSRRNTSENIFTVKSETAGFSGKPA